MSEVVKCKVEKGISLQIGEVWHKFSYGIEVELVGENLKEVNQKAWNTVNIELEKQIKETLEEC